MTTIPDDIMAAARTVADGEVNFGSYEVNALAIARAILAERERCAKVAQDAADEHYMIIKAGKGEHGKPGYVADAVWHSWVGRHGALSSIAAAIRSQS